MKKNFVILFVGLALFISLSPEVFAAEKGAAQISEKKMKQLRDSLSSACRQHSQLKDPELSKKVCACVARNHALQSNEGQLKRLTARYRAGLKGLKATNADESMLFDFDLKLAEACLENPEFQVPSSH